MPSSTKTHPHIDNPSEEQLLQVLESRPAAICQLYLDVHRLVLETLPDVRSSVDCQDGTIGYGARQYGYSGWGMAALSPYSSWISLYFMRAADLEDRFGLFEGTGKMMRPIKLHTQEQFQERKEALRGLILAAAQINQG